MIVFFDGEQGKVLKISKTDAGRYDELNEGMVPIPGNQPIHLRMEIDRAQLQFTYSLDEKNWTDIGPVLDSTILFGEYDGLNFTGAFAGMAVFDYRSQSKKALFDYFEYLPRGNTRNKP